MTTPQPTVKDDHGKDVSCPDHYFYEGEWRCSRFDWFACKHCPDRKTDPMFRKKD